MAIDDRTVALRALGGLWVLAAIALVIFFAVSCVLVSRYVYVMSRDVMAGYPTYSFAPVATPRPAMVPSLHLEPVGQLGGSVRALAFADPYMYVGFGPRLAVVDPRRVGFDQVLAFSEVLPDVVYGVTVADSLAYVATGEAGLRIFDVGSQVKPQELARVGTPGHAEAVSVSEGHAYVADLGGGLRVIDIEPPGQAKEVGSVENIGWVSDVHVAGSHAFVVAGHGGLLVYDIGTPADPVLVGAVQDFDYVSHVQVVGDFAYLVDVVHGLRVLDVSVPSDPQPLSLLDLPQASSCLFVSDHVAYLAQGSSVVQVDVFDPFNPRVKLRGKADFETAHDIVITKDSVYVAAGHEGLRSNDATGSGTPQRRRHVAVLSDLHEVEVEQSVAHMVGRGSAGYRLVDVSSPAALQATGAIRAFGIVERLHVLGDLAYVAAGQEGVRVVSAVDPGSPQDIGRAPATGAAVGIHVDPGHASVAAGSDGLQIFDVSSPKPKQVAKLNVDRCDQAYDVAVADGFAYIAARGCGVRVVDVSSPSEPVDLGTVRIRGRAQHIELEGATAYVVTTAPDGLRVLSLAVPQAPREISFVQLPEPIRDIRVVDGFAYVASDLAGVRVIDLAAPLSPSDVARIDLPREVTGLDVEDGRLYVVTRHAGLMVYEIVRP